MRLDPAEATRTRNGDITPRTAAQRRRRYSHKTCAEVARLVRAETVSLPIRQRMIGSTIAHIVRDVGLDGIDDTAGQIASAAGMAASGSARSAVKAVWDHLEGVGLVETVRRPKVGDERGTPKLHRFLFPRPSDVWEGEVFYRHPERDRPAGDLETERHPPIDKKAPADGTERDRLAGDTHSSSLVAHSAGAPGDVPEHVYETGLVGGGRWQIVDGAA